MSYFTLLLLERGSNPDNTFVKRRREGKSCASPSKLRAFGDIGVHYARDAALRGLSLALEANSLVTGGGRIFLS